MTIQKIKSTKFHSSVNTKSVVRERDCREIITHVQFPEDGSMQEVNMEVIQRGMKLRHIITEKSLQKRLGHLFTPTTLYQYARSSDIFDCQTVFNFPRPLLIKETRMTQGRPRIKQYYLLDEVKFYVNYVEDLRDQEILNRPQGHLVLPPRRPGNNVVIPSKTEGSTVQKYKVNSFKNWISSIKEKLI